MRSVAVLSSNTIHHIHTLTPVSLKKLKVFSKWNSWWVFLKLMQDNRFFNIFGSLDFLSDCSVCHSLGASPVRIRRIWWRAWAAATAGRFWTRIRWFRFLWTAATAGKFWRKWKLWSAATRVWWFRRFLRLNTNELIICLICKFIKKLNGNLPNVCFEILCSLNVGQADFLICLIGYCDITSINIYIIFLFKIFIIQNFVLVSSSAL